MMRPLISVVVPIYNIEKYIQRCINSITEQTYQNLEIILVDDGSTDMSGHICDENAMHDVRIKVIHKENGGLSDARNAAIDCAQGEWITFVDGDDFLTKTAIDSMYKTAEITNAQMVCCLFKTVYEGKDTYFDEIYDERKISVYSKINALNKMLHRSLLNDAADSKLYQIKLFDNIRYPKGEVYEDIGTTYKLYSAAEKIALIRIDGCGYFMREGSIQNSKFTKKKMSELRFVKEQKEYLDKKFPELEMATTDRLVSSCFHILFAIIGQKEFEAEQKEVEKLIRKYRKKLIISKETSHKTRLGCILSFFGFHTEFLIYRLLRIRGKDIG